MPKRRSAPRKRIDDKVRKELRSARLSAVPQVANAGKLAIVHQRMDYVRTLKNRMSKHVHRNLPALFKAPLAFKAGYPQFSGTGVLNAWEMQTLFQGICGDYERAWDRRVQQHLFFVQAGWSAGRYVRQVIRQAGGVTQVMYLPGSPKPGDFSVKRQQTDLTRAASYLLRVSDLATFDAERVKDDGLRVVMIRLRAAPAKWSRLCALVEARRARTLAKMKLQQYRTGTHTIHPEIGTSGLILDESNSKYRYFLKVRKTDKKKDGHVYLPLLVDRTRIDPAELRTNASFCSRQPGVRFTSS